MPKDEFGTNQDNLFQPGDTYIETLVVNGRMVNVFENDYGQCYWFQWVENGEIKSNTCGTYVTDYKEQIEDYFKEPIDRAFEMIHNLRIDVNDLTREVNKLREDLNIKDSNNE